MCNYIGTASECSTGRIWLHKMYSIYQVLAGDKFYTVWIRISTCTICILSAKRSQCMSEGLYRTTFGGQVMTYILHTYIYLHILN